MSEIFKPCPFCGHKKARVTERKEYKRSGHYKHDDEWLRKNMEEWLKNSTDDWIEEVVIKVYANVMCNACKAKGGTAVGFIEGYPRPSERMKRQFNVERLDGIHNRAIKKWNRRNKDE